MKHKIRFEMIDSHSNGMPVQPAPVNGRCAELRERANWILNALNDQCECDGDVGMSPCLDCVTNQLIRDLLTALDEQQKVVERLPKDATNKTIVYGDEKWWLEPGGSGDAGIVRVTCQEATPLPHGSRYRTDYGYTHRIAIKMRGTNAMNGELFDTREAAEAARTAQADEQGGEGRGDV